MLLALSLLAAATACSGDDDGGDTTATTAADTTTSTIGVDWDDAAGERAEAIGAALEAAGHGCADVGPYPRASYLITFVALDWPIPEWAGNCTLALNEEDLQVEVYADAATVAERIETRAERLCLETDDNFPGYAYLAGDDFVLTPDSREAAELIAPATGVEARYEDCAAVRRAAGDGAATTTTEG
jgi:hypothetical protein